MLSLMEWGDRYLNDGDGPVGLRPHHRPVRVELRTPSVGGRTGRMDVRLGDPAAHVR
jgi:hypothetical protein